MNVQQQMDALLAQQNGAKRLLLHSCCGPCSSYVLEYLSPHFAVTVLYYNPCIQPAAEFERRLAEQKRIIAQLPTPQPVALLVPPYEPATFLQAVQGLEDCPEGGERCAVCFRQRLAFTARTAAEQGFDYFATTLTVSPHKNALLINQVGAEQAASAGAVYLPSDFKKKNGYLRSLALSRQYGLYRQDYCGCVFSLKQRQAQKEAQHE